MLDQNAFGSLLFVSDRLLLITETCGGNVSGSVGFIQSPGFPHNYGNNELCEWTILGEPGNLIQVTFSTVDLEESCCNCDTITLRYVTSSDLSGASSTL